MLPNAPRFVVPEIITTHFHIREGDVVADFGAGVGFFVPALAAKVGDEGRLYACEIQKALIEKLGAQAHSLGLANVHPLWCDLEEMNGIKIESGTVDVALLINTLYQVEDKDTAIKEMARTVRSGGKFFVVDWTESVGGIGPAADLVLQPDAAKALFEQNEFVFERDFDAGDHHYGLAFRKL